MRYVDTVWRTLLALMFPSDPQDVWLETISCDDFFARFTEDTVWVHRRVDCLSPLRYTHREVGHAVKAVKYRNNEHMAHLLGEGIAPYLAEEIAERRLFGTYTDPVCIPIPLHSARQRERGFNQSERIATAMLQGLGSDHVPCLTHALVRTKRTNAQARTQHKQERAKNMRGAFSVPDPSLVTGRDIILVDDVITTGSTLYEAARSLRDAGARTVLCVAVAH